MLYNEEDILVTSELPNSVVEPPGHIPGMRRGHPKGA